MKHYSVMAFNGGGLNMSHDILSPHGDIISSTTQEIANITLAQAVTFDSDPVSKQFKHDVGNPSHLLVSVPGVYYLNYTLNVNLTSGSNKTMETWVRVNGADVADSNNIIFVRTAGRERSSIQAFLGAVIVDDFIEVMISGDTTSLEILALAAGVSPVRPATPSIKALAFKVSDIYPA